MTPLNERQFYQLFLNLLEAQGYAVVPMENNMLQGGEIQCRESRAAAAGW
ncbi:hypothetical protein ACLB1E_11405 [Escherichia coli]